MRSYFCCGSHNILHVITSALCVLLQQPRTDQMSFIMNLLCSLLCSFTSTRAPLNNQPVPVSVPADLKHLYPACEAGGSLLDPACVGEQRGDKHRLCCCCQETCCKAALLRTAKTINSSAQSFTGTTHHITHVAKQQHGVKQRHCILYYI